MGPALFFSALRKIATKYLEFPGGVFAYMGPFLGVLVAVVFLQQFFFL